MEDTITLTQAELDAKIDEAVKKNTETLEAKHSNDMYNLRQENKKLKDAGKSQEDLMKEKDEAIAKELAELRGFRKQSIISDRLAKEGLPSYFKNDSRLLAAEDGDVDKVLKTIKKEYEETLPKGNTHSTVVKTSGNQAPLTDKKDGSPDYSGLLGALKEAIR